MWNANKFYNELNLPLHEAAHAGAINWVSVIVNDDDMSFNTDYVKQLCSIFYLPNKDCHTYEQMGADYISYPDMKICFNKLQKGYSTDWYRTRLENIIASNNNSDKKYKIDIINTRTISKDSRQFIHEYLKTNHEELKYASALTTNVRHDIKVYKMADNKLLILTNINDADIMTKIIGVVAHFRFLANPEYYKPKEYMVPIYELLTNDMINTDSDSFIKHITEYMLPLKDIIAETVFNKSVNTIIEYLPKAVTRSVRSKIENSKRSIQDYRQALATAYTTIREHEMTLLGIESTVKESAEDLKSILSTSRKNISNIRTTDNGTKIILTVVQPLLYWEDDMYAILKKNNDAYRGAFQYIRDLLDAIFLHKTYTLIFEHCFTLDTTNNAVNHHGNSYSSTESKGIPNPHMHYYNCWGNNEPIIIEALSKGDYTTAFLQTTAAIAGLNLADGAVTNKFIQNLLTSHPFNAIKCLKNNETGELISIKEFKVLSEPAPQPAPKATPAPLEPEMDWDNVFDDDDEDEEDE